MPTLYSALPGLVLGFHGCDQKIGESVLEGNSRLKPSENTHDWLGSGVYFWENNPARALSYAEEIKDSHRKEGPKIETPFVLGAVIDLGVCLNLLDESALEEVRQSYEFLRISAEASNSPLPTNRPISNGSDLLKRYLDCAVIESIHAERELSESEPYHSVRGVFWEGHELYPNAGFKEKNHIQICIRNPNCIKGYFRVRDLDRKYLVP